MYCDCENGTRENGWHETRGAHCRAEELRQWEGIVELARETVAQILARKPEGDKNLHLMRGEHQAMSGYRKRANAAMLRGDDA